MKIIEHKLLHQRCNNCGKFFSYRKAYFHRREYPYTCNYCIMHYLNRPNPQEKHRSSRYRHGHVFEGKKTKLYRLWSTIKDRCTNKNCKMYKYYGGKGITVCDRWSDFVLFKADVEELGYKEGYSILRIRRNEGYEPNNIKIREGKGYSNYHRYKGNSLTVGQLVKFATNGITVPRLQVRLRTGWTVDEALSEPLRRKRCSQKMN